jgi:hypothetical protein
MNGQLYVNPDDMRGITLTYDEVADGLSQLIGSAPPASGIESSLGVIASPVLSALGGAFPSRETALGITRTATEVISRLVSEAIRMYEQGDAEGAAKLRAAAEALEAQQGGDGSEGGRDGGAAGSQGGGGSGASGSGSSGTGSGGGNGADTASQMAGQVGQQVGQLGQTLAQSVQGLAQIPMAIMAGVQGIVQAAVGAGGTGGLDDKAEPKGKGDGRGKGEDGQLTDDDADPGGKGEDGPQARDKAEPGGKGLGPVPEVPIHRAAPAQTRPQQSPL